MMRENGELFLGLALVLAIAFAFVFSNVSANHEPKPDHVPLGVVGSPRSVEALTVKLDRSAPGGFELHRYASPGAARTAILHRNVYGAVETGPPPTLLVASAASAAVARMLEQTFGAATRPQGQTVPVQDVVALPSSDSSGATSFSAVLSLTLAAILGATIIYLATRQRRLEVRLAALGAVAVGAGLIAALTTNLIVGAFPGHFLAVWAVTTLFVLAVSLPVAAVQELVGPNGALAGFLLFVVLGTPGSGGSSAPELLPDFWRVAGRLLPPGAGTTALRDLVYFNGHGVTEALTVLGTWAVLGGAAVILAQRLSVRIRTTITSRRVRAATS